MSRNRTVLLYNCTSQLFEFDEFANASSFLSFNESSVSDVLDMVFDDEDERLSEGVRTKAKDFIKTCMLPPTPRDLVWWQKLAWSLIFAVMLVIATGGNSIVMWIVLAHKRMRTVTNYLLVNLSISDLLMSLLNCVFNFIFMLNSHWPFGKVYCSISNFVSSVTVAAGVFTLMVISYDRYMAIVKPLRHRMTHTRARVALILIWFSSVLLGIPPLVYSTTMTRRYADGQIRVICYMLWPDGTYPTSLTEYVYNVVFLAVTYIVPMTVMAVCYTLMGIELWGSRSIGELTQRQRDSMKSKKKVVRMFIIVVTIFAFCWLPYHGYFIYAYHNNAVAASDYVQHVFLSFYWLAMSNAMVNPIIYYWMNARFRVYFQKIIFCRCLGAKLRKNDPPATPQVGRGSKHKGQPRTKLERAKYGSTKWQRRTDTSNAPQVPNQRRNANEVDAARTT